MFFIVNIQYSLFMFLGTISTEWTESTVINRLVLLYSLFQFVSIVHRKLANVIPNVSDGISHNNVLKSWSSVLRSIWTITLTIMNNKMTNYEIGQKWYNVSKKESTAQLVAAIIFCGTVWLTIPESIGKVISPTAGKR